MTTPVILPTTCKKYMGSIHPHGKGFRIIATNKIFTLNSGIFQTYEEALQILHNYHIQNNIPIKNLVYDHGDHLECTIGDGLQMKFDREDLETVQKYNFSSVKRGKKYYAATGSKGKVQFFHNIILGYTATISDSIDHINRDGLDNRRSNLRVADRAIQKINQDIQKNNTSGTKGVYKEQDTKSKNWSWVASWSEDGRRRKRRFCVCKYGDDVAMNKAIELRAQMEQLVPKYVEALQH